jgi:hypothetical protein
LLVYAVPVVAWVFEPVRVSARRRERPRRRPRTATELEADALSRAA